MVGWLLSGLTVMWHFSAARPGFKMWVLAVLLDLAWIAFYVSYELWGPTVMIGCFLLAHTNNARRVKNGVQND